MDGNRGTPRSDRTTAEREAARLRRVWQSKLRVVTQKYAELERAIEDAAFAEHAFNLAQRAAKLDRNNAGGVALALLGAVTGDPQTSFV